ncbi:MAG: TatD family hydrolase [Bacteroidales bacterium]|nr:TatD family hydrolase [Bacteroidales bacterium]
MVEYIDTHTHITDEAFRGEEEQVIERAEEAGVTRMLLADIDSGGRDAVYAVCDAHPGVLFPMLGLYPGSVDARWREELDALPAWLGKNPAAIGEIGLDYHYGTEFRKEQMEVLRLQLEFASAHDLPVNIHLRDATEDFIKVLEDCRHLHLRGNLHAFSGSAETFERVARTGDWYVALGGVLTFRNASIARDAVRIPLERILLETDAPYLAPTPLRGSRNESANIPRIAEFLAGIMGISVGEVARATTRNAVRLFPRIARKNEINIAH